jgi:hypothetical protein
MECYEHVKIGAGDTRLSNMLSLINMIITEEEIDPSLF